MSPGPLMIGLEGPQPTEAEYEQLRHPLVGGVILFGRNIESPRQVGELADILRRVRRPELLIAVDQEGGRVQRLRDGYALLPPPGRLGAVYDREPERGLMLAHTYGWLLAVEVRAAGFDFSFAPVLDLNRGSSVIGDRAFHSEPSAVVKLAQAGIAGMREAGMAAVGKHFPGHGSVYADSHYELPRDTRSLSEILQSDMLPFAELIPDGLPGVMASHVVYTEVDDVGADFSPFWLHETLRRRLAFQGAVFSDDLCMAAAAAIGDVTERVKRALAAGCDMAIVADPDEVPEVLDRVSAESDPTRQARLTSLRGTGRTTLERLHKTLDWRNARDRLEALVS